MHGADGIDCDFCDIESFRTAEVLIEAELCVYASGAPGADDVLRGSTSAFGPTATTSSGTSGKRAANRSSTCTSSSSPGSPTSRSPAEVAARG